MWWHRADPRHDTAALRYTGAFPELPAPAVHDQDATKPGAVPPIAEDGGDDEEDGGSDGSASAEAGTAAAPESKRADADDSDAPPTPAEIKSMQEQVGRCAPRVHA